MKLGYACINMTLGYSDQRVTTNRTMQRKTLETRGLSYVSELAIENIKDLIKIIIWNERNGIQFYRMSSDLFPWQSEYEFKDLPQIDELSRLLKRAGTLANSLGHRISFHPGPFIVLSSPNIDVVRRSLYEIEQHSSIIDMMGLPTNQYSKINIHLGGAYGDKKSAMSRWSENFFKLSENARSRLSIENDDKSSCYSVDDLMEVHENTGVPIVFDYHHHLCYDDATPEGVALHKAAKTWPKGILPVVHVSEPRDDENPRAHHDYVVNEIRSYGVDFDIMFEAKKKELALLKYRKLFLDKNIKIKNQ
jgi:UV DNA damage endonuclease